MLAPGSVWPTKRWDWAQFREVAKHFTSLGQRVILIGSPAEVSVCEQVARDLPVTNLAGHHSLAETLYIVQQAGLVICNDSMVLHLASAFKIPTVTVFCATSPRFGFGPWQNRALVVEHQGLSCKPCRRHGGLTCPTGTEACMREVPASQVLAAVQQLEGMK